MSKFFHTSVLQGSKGLVRHLVACAGSPNAWMIVASAAALAVSAAPVASASASATMYVSEIESPIRVVVEVETDLLAYDLCWSSTRDGARDHIAGIIANRMEDPARMYVIALPQLPRTWEAVKSSSGLEDLEGNLIDPKVLRSGKLRYESDVESALIDILNRVREDRPGALLSIEGFEPRLSTDKRSKRNGSEISYGSLAGSMDFVVSDSEPNEAEFKEVFSPDRRKMVSSREEFNKVSSTSEETVIKDDAVLAMSEDLVVAYSTDLSADESWFVADDEPVLEPTIDSTTQAAWSTETQRGNGYGRNNGGGDSDSGNGNGKGKNKDTGSTDSGTTDSGSTDSGSTDSGSTDSGSTDSGSTDSGSTDNGGTDGGSTDPGATDGDTTDVSGTNGSGSTDGGSTDGGSTDGGSTDGGSTDGGSTDGGSTDGGSTDGGSTDGGSTDGGSTDGGTSGGGGTGDGGTTDTTQPTEPPYTADAIFLAPGNGFSGATMQPAVQGDPNAYGADATAIGRWDVVPYQTITGPFEIGVVAFHINGIAGVDFSLNGGEWLRATEMTQNPRTGVWEYTAVIDPSLMNDGDIEVRAIIYPTNGIPRVLQGSMTSTTIADGDHSLFMTANANGTLPALEIYVDSVNGSDETGDGSSGKPYKSLDQALRAQQSIHGSLGGATVYMAPGDYHNGVNGLNLNVGNRWLTLMGDPSADVRDVRISSTQSAGLRSPKLRLSHLMVDDTYLHTGNGSPALWLENALLESTSPISDQPFVNISSWNGGVWATGTTIRNTKRASVGFSLLRNCLLEDIGGDAMVGPRFVVDTEVRRVLKVDGVTHTDVMQFGGPDFENIIIYGLKAMDQIEAQAIFTRRDGTQGDTSFNNSAFVNCFLRSETNYGQWSYRGDHLLFWHFSHLGKPFSVRDDGSGLVTTLTNFSIRHSIFDMFAYTASGQPLDALQIYNNHFITGTAVGASATLGDAYFVSDFDASQPLNFSPAVGSPLRDRMNDKNKVVPADIRRAPLGSLGAIGPIQPN